MSISSVHKNEGHEFHKAIADVSKIISRDIEIFAIEDVVKNYNELINFDGSINPSLILHSLNDELTSREKAIVLVSPNQIVGNYFFLLNKGCNPPITICSVYNWQAFRPLSLKCYILYVAVKSLLFYYDDFTSHFKTNNCIFDYCQNKTDINVFLSPENSGEHIFCKECAPKFSKLKITKQMKYRRYTAKLFNWIRLDYAEFNVTLNKYAQISRVRDISVSNFVKSNYYLQLENRFYLSGIPSLYYYKYLIAESYNHEGTDEIVISKIIEKYKENNLLSKIFDHESR